MRSQLARAGRLGLRLLSSLAVRNPSNDNTRTTRQPKPILELLESREVPAVAQPQYILMHHAGSAQPFVSSGPTGLTPAQVRHAYGFDQISFSNGTIAGDGSGTTIAIVDAYDDPTAASDLQKFDATFNLPDPTFTKVNQTGGSTMPTANSGWATEIALDVEWAHAIAPKANILLVEANSSSTSDLFAAVRYAAAQSGVVAVSMSWGAGEYSGENLSDSTFTTPSGHAGVTFVVSSGDSGAPVSYPAASPNVLAVGGTTLSVNSSGTYQGESAWSGSGGGISSVESQPSYQKGIVTQTTTKRANPDVSYDSNPNTGFPVYDSYSNGTATPWIQVGGTSDAAPQWAALIAIADQGLALNNISSLDGPSQTLPMLYQLPHGDFHDITSGSSTGSPNYSAGPGYDLATGMGTPIANLLVSDLVASLSSQAKFSDPGFESPSVGSGVSAYKYDPSSGTPWTFSGLAGVTGNSSAFTGSNQSAPQGTQVAFLQQTGSVSQAVNFAAGNYTISFSAAQRQNNQASSQTIQVTVDGNVLGTITPSGTSYATYTTVSFTVTAGNHTIAFVGLNPNGGDNTAFLDWATITTNSTVSSTSQAFSDPGFESPSEGTGGSAYVYDPSSGTPWTYTGLAGVAGNGSAFTSGNPSAPQGTQVAFLQGTGSFSQAVTFNAGTYTISFSAAQRQNHQTSSQTIQITVDGNAVDTITPSGTSYATYTTASFTVTAGSHTIAFVGQNPNGGDNTAFLDRASINTVSSSPTFSDSGFENLSVGTGASAYKYDPTSGTPWTFSGLAGVAGNGSAFTSGNPSAPQGTQVAFLQETGSFSQAVTFSAGNYTISFSAAQRQNYQSSQQVIEVLVDGSVLSTITPSGTSYATYTTASFTVTAGSHTIAFVGLNPNGGDNTAFLDQITIQ
jgi:subtilase family serine protease